MFRRSEPRSNINGCDSLLARGARQNSFGRGTINIANTRISIGKFITAALLFSAVNANAQNITYNVDRGFGGGWITGTIETDGHLGSLSPDNIVSWSFVAFDGTDEVSISSATGGFLNGTAWSYLTATSTDLSFDFDGALADPDPSVEFISFVDGNEQVPETSSYNLLGNFLGPIEQIVHQFGVPPENGGHVVNSQDRQGSVVIARTENQSAVNCGAPVVSLGEVMAGFQAGFTAGSHTEFGPAGDYMLGLFGEDRRGFMIPESIDLSNQCENDFILVSGFIGTLITRASGVSVRSPKEAIDRVNSGFNGRIVGQRFEVDGVLIEHMNTPAKIGSLPSGATLAVMSSGIIIEPYSLAQGWHIASIAYELDTTGDGMPDSEDVVSTVFRINAAE